MATWEVTAPDGSVWDMEGPDDATPEQLEAAAQQHFSSQPPQEAPRPAPGFWKQFAYGFDTSRGLSQGAVEEFARQRRVSGETIQKGLGKVQIPGPFAGVKAMFDVTRPATEEEMAAAQQRSDLETDLELRAEHPDVYNDPEAREGVGVTIGSMVKQMLDPTMVLGPAAGTGLKGAALINAGLMAADSSAMQALETGEVDPKVVVLSAAAAAALGPAAKLIGRGAGKLVGKRGPAAQKAVQDKVVEAGARKRVYTELGLNEAEATARAVRDISPKNPELRVTEQETVDLIKKVQRGPQLGEGVSAMNTRNAINKRVAALSGTQRDLKKFEAQMNKAIIKERKSKGNEFTAIYRSAYDALSRVSAKLANRLRRYEFELGSITTRRLRDDTPEGLGLLRGSDGSLNGRTLKEWKKTSPTLRRDTKLAMFNGDTKQLDALLPKLPASVQDTVTKWRGLREEYRTRIQESGHGDLDWVEEYFPREFVSDEHMAQHFLKKGVDGKIISQAESDLQRLYKGDPDSLTREKRLQVLNAHARSPETPGAVRTGPTSQMKAREVDVIGTSDLDAMRDPFETMAKYVNDVEANLAKRRLFGVDPNDLEGSLGAITDGLVRSGDATPADAELARRILQARFVTGERSMSKAFQNVRNVTNAALLGNPGSALIQFGDVAVGMAHNGVRNTMRSVWEVMGRNQEVSKIDLGITDVAAELNQHAQKGTGAVLDTLLTWTGFRKADTFGKDTAIQGGLNKLRGWAKKTPGKLETKYKDALNPDELQALTDALRQGGRVNDLSAEQQELVRYALFNELSDMQPVSLSELPVKYLEMRNGRMSYQLKSFTIKQFELVRREFFNKLRRNPAEAIKFGSKYILATGMLSGSIDFARDALTGKYKEGDESAIDQGFWNGAENILLSASGGTLNRWTLNNLSRGDIAGGVADMILPPGLSVATNIAQGIAQERPDKALRYIPVIGVFAPWMGDS